MAGQNTPERALLGQRCVESFHLVSYESEREKERTIETFIYIYIYIMRVKERWERHADRKRRDD